jgi:trans-2,3-dihydro-3-hydroxyanthranilate isomerase
MRIFTPAVEMPMAGHPTVGSTFALAHTGTIPRGRARFVFGLNVGPTPVDLEWEGDRLRFVWMTQGRPVFSAPVADRAAVASALGLDPADLADLPIQEVSCGVPYLYVPLRDREAVDRATPNGVSSLDLPVLSKSHPAVLLFSVNSDWELGVGGWEFSTYSRMFAPDLGVVEDPATGSAAGPLGCYLVQHGRVSGERAKEIVNAQGVKMGRASRLHISIGGTPGAITEVKVGGEAVLIARGEFLATAAR